VIEIPRGISKEGWFAMTVVTASTLRQPIGDSGVEMGSTDIAGMSVVAHRMPAGFDATDLLRAAVGDPLCPVPHWFVVTKGAIGIRYTDDDSQETARAGDVAYLRPGHAVWAEEDSELVEISPADGNGFLMARIQSTGLMG
jgi:hypothetical protein